MTLQMNYQEKFEEGLEQGIERGMEQERMKLALRMARAGELPPEKIAMYTGLSLRQIMELQEI